MFDAYSKQVNDTFNEIYDSIQRVEEQMLSNSKLDLSICELDILESVGKFGEAGCSISEIARDYRATLPTITVAIKRLESKGYVEKVRSSTDGRKVNVVLNRNGKKADAVHRYFHERMVRSFLREVSQEQRPMLLRALQNLAGFLQQMGEV